MTFHKVLINVYSIYLLRNRKRNSSKKISDKEKYNIEGFYVNEGRLAKIIFYCMYFR